jgi:protein-S-isoprenylcysteine O-methyltransferase Ste14
MRAWRWRNVPMPEPHLGGLVAGILLGTFASWPLFSAPWLGHVTGWPLVLAGFWLATWAVMAAASVNVAVPNRLVVQGPYAFSRNPMYVAWTLGYLGITFVANTAWPLVALPVVLLMTHVVVLREERYLEGRFGAEYQRYMRSVRRYLW